MKTDESLLYLGKPCRKWSEGGGKCKRWSVRKTSGIIKIKWRKIFKLFKIKGVIKCKKLDCLSSPALWRFSPEDERKLGRHPLSAGDSGSLRGAWQRQRDSLAKGNVRKLLRDNFRGDETRMQSRRRLHWKGEKRRRGTREKKVVLWINGIRSKVGECLTGRTIRDRDFRGGHTGRAQDTLRAAAEPARGGSAGSATWPRRGTTAHLGRRRDGGGLRRHPRGRDTDAAE